ncbi:hypothetical protein TNCT_583731 [Trichonephila clavata]|uniref:Uncharacterized protein n=1 Tax=Trichonephila clavata TaxID=2740835 RepID=A0A8X6L3S5_TRICU|nr:hypothetical protein TNCT_583731 [Trichonephila clavata]
MVNTPFHRVVSNTPLQQPLNTVPTPFPFKRQTHMCHPTTSLSLQMALVTDCDVTSRFRPSVAAVPPSPQTQRRSLFRVSNRQRRTSQCTGNNTSSAQERYQGNTIHTSSSARKVCILNNMKEFAFAAIFSPHVNIALFRFDT